MKNKPTHIVVKFLYADNDQLYETAVLMTDLQRRETEEMFRDLREKGLVKEVREGSGFTTEFSIPAPLTFATFMRDLKANSYFDAEDIPL